MGFVKSKVISNTQVLPDVHIIRIKPLSEEVYTFLPGQFCRLKNPSFTKPDDARCFSIASSPETKEYLEFCIKAYGGWTRSMVKKIPGDIIQVAGPYGKFTWENNDPYAVFLAGGVGIAPILSMLRHIALRQIPVKALLLYGNRRPETVVYNEEIENLAARITHFSLVEVMSEMRKKDSWSGYRGFITSEVLKNEVDFSQSPTFYTCGPPAFVVKMDDVLTQLGVEKRHCKQETLTGL